MSLDTVAEDITDDARERAERIREEADERAEEIIAEAETDAANTKDERAREVEDTIEREREQTRSSANLEAKQQRLEARRDALESTREEVEERVAAIDGEEREELTRALLDDATTEFASDASVRVAGRPEDEDLLESIVAEYEGFEYAGEYDCLGGVVAASEASRVRVTNTFDSILDRVWENELQETSARLFDE
jgi:V/A-type H+-transporting ATPase subunit E